MKDDLVRAAGGIAWRIDDDGEARVLVVHRPRWDDWSFPKGKLDPGESFEEAARRELHEETGYAVELGDELGSADYTDHRGRPKVVRYWELTVVGHDEFVPNDEIDEVRWLTVPEARGQLSYAHDRDLLTALVPRIPAR